MTGIPIAFTVEATGDELQFLWEKDGKDIDKNESRLTGGTQLQPGEPVYNPPEQHSFTPRPNHPEAPICKLLLLSIAILLLCVLVFCCRYQILCGCTVIQFTL